MATSPPSGQARCDTHRGQQAGWRCRACGAALCPGCTWTHEVGPTTVVACGRCRGLADPITVRRAARQTFASRLPGALVFPVVDGGWRTLLGAALVFWAFSWAGLIGAVLAYGLQWGLFFSVIRRTAHTAEPLDTPGYDGLWEDVLRPALRGLLAMALVWVPAGIWLIETADLDALAQGAWLGDPVLWLLLLVGVAWAPAALTVASVTTSTLAVLDPRLPLAMARRLGGDYALLVVTALLAAFGDVLAGLAAGLVRALPVPVVAGVAAKALTLWAPLSFARAAGLLIHTRGDELDYGLPGDYQEPVLGAVAPRGAPPPPPLVPPEVQRRLEAIELDPEPAGAPTVEPGGEPAGPAAGPLPAAPRAAPAPAPDGRPDPSRLFERARAAAAAGRFAESADLLRAAAEDEGHPVAPTAWLVLGRLYASRLDHPEAARQALEYLAARWPDGEPARQARALLGAP